MCVARDGMLLCVKGRSENEEFFAASDPQSDDSDDSSPRGSHSSRRAGHKYAKWLVRVAGSALNALQERSRPGGTTSEPRDTAPEIQDEMLSLRKRLLALRQSGDLCRHVGHNLLSAKQPR